MPPWWPHSFWYLLATGWDSAFLSPSRQEQDWAKPRTPQKRGEGGSCEGEDVMGPQGHVSLNSAAPVCIQMQFWVSEKRDPWAVSALTGPVAGMTCSPLLAGPREPCAPGALGTLCGSALLRVCPVVPSDFTYLFFLHNYLFIYLNWSLVSLQCCVSVWCTAQCFSHT